MGGQLPEVGTEVVSPVAEAPKVTTRALVVQLAPIVGLTISIIVAIIFEREEIALAALGALAAYSTPVIRSK